MTTRRVYYFATPPFYHSTSLLILPPHRLTTRPVYYLAAPLFDHFTGLPICQPYRLTNCFRKSLRRGWQALTATARQPTFPKLPATSLAHDRPAWPPPACAPQDRPTQAARPPEPPATPSHLAPPVGSRSPRGGGGSPAPVVWRPPTASLSHRGSSPRGFSPGRTGRPGRSHRGMAGATRTFLDAPRRHKNRFPYKKCPAGGRLPRANRCGVNSPCQRVGG